MFGELEHRSVEWRAATYLVVTRMASVSFEKHFPCRRDGYILASAVLEAKRSTINILNGDGPHCMSYRTRLESKATVSVQ